MLSARAAAGAAWVNISWAPGWSGQLAEFRTKLLAHCLKSRLATESRDNMIIYHLTQISAEPQLCCCFTEMMRSDQSTPECRRRDRRAETITHLQRYRGALSVHNRCIYFELRERKRDQATTCCIQSVSQVPASRIKESETHSSDIIHHVTGMCRGRAAAGRQERFIVLSSRPPCLLLALSP